MQPINLKEKFSLIKDYWNPHIVAELNGQHLRLAKLKGDFVWHSHQHEDELFMVIKGCLIIHLREQSVTINEGECFVVPKGVEHRPYAEDEVHVLLVEPAATKHTGDVISEQTKTEFQTI